MKYIYTLVICLLLSTIAFGQVNLNGKILNSDDKKGLVNASIVLLNQDSVLQHFTRANEDGYFEFKGIKPNDYLFIVSYPKFELYSTPINLQKNTNLNNIELTSRTNLIEEVLVTAKIPIRIKGDTIEYDAGSFETEKNAKLEDLLRRLPGLTVSSNGEVTAHGKTVSKVLIDGEEFFGYDPKIAIRNIRADAVDKVQVYERKSEEAELTGIDDGQRFQTVNVVLKEEARKGIFGNAEAHVGTDELYSGNLFAAKFNRTERLGITANTNNMGANSGGREGGLRMNSQITGDPRNTSIGANYENQFFNKRLNVNSNYNFSDASNRNERTNYNKEIISPEEIQETNSFSKNKNSSQGHSVRGNFKMRLDSTSNMDMIFNARKSQSNSWSESENRTMNNGVDSIRDYNSTNRSEGNDFNNDIRINYRKRLNRKGRALNIHLSNTNSSSEQESDVFQRTYLHTLNSEKIVDQDRFTTRKSNDFSTQIQFSDRISDKINYSLGYHFGTNNSTNKVNAYELTDNGQVMDMTYSQNQHNKTQNQAIVANMTYNIERIFFTINNRTNYRNQSLEDSYRDVELNRNFWDNDLTMSANYKISNRKNINASFNQNFDVPSFNQLQPIQPQTSEIFRQEGNPDLKRAINNAISLSYNTLSILKGTSWNINTSFNVKSNPIVNKRTVTDSITISTYVNVMGKSSWNANLNTNYSIPLFNQTVQFSIFSGANYNNGYSYTRYQAQGGNPNQGQYLLNNTQNSNLYTGISFNEQNSKGFDYDFSWRVTMNNQQNSLQKDLNYTNFITGGNSYVKYFLPKKFNVAVNAHYNLEGATKLYRESIQQFYVNLEVSKKLLKSESLTASIRAYDIFNTYNTTNRNVSEYEYSESSQMMLTRYVLFGLKWDFNKNLGKKSND